MISALTTRTNLNSYQRYIFRQLTAVFVFCTTSLQVSIAHHVQDAKFISVAVFRLSEHIYWPNAKDIKNYHIHIIDDEPDVENQLKQISTIRKLHNRPLIVSRSNNDTIPSNTHIIFLANHKAQLLPGLLKKINDLPILVISFDAQDKRIVMINLKTDSTETTKVTFEINKANLLNRGMSVDPDIILLGGTEIDVAHLYRQAQTDLSNKIDEFRKIENKIQKINQEKESIESSLSELTKTIQKQKQSYKKLEEDTKEQERIIRKQIVELQNRERHLDKQKTEIEKRSVILKMQQQDIDNQLETISGQELIIKKQKETLVQNKATIQNQRTSLLTLSVLILLAILGAAFSLWLYIKNRRINSKLLIALNDAKQYANRLEIANEQLKSFSYTVSHDLRSPLRVISSFSQIIIEDFSEDLKEEAINHLQRIIVNVKKMDNLITDILTLSKLSQSEVNYIDNVNLSDIVLKELEQLNQYTPRTSVKFDIKQNIISRCDPKLIKIALANILGNSWKYTPDTQDARFEFGTTIINNDTVFYFRDNGVGFDMDNADKLFEPFKRLHNEQQFEGTGIGLATVKRIINLHHGNIWAESEINKGSTFYFTLGTNLK